MPSKNTRRKAPRNVGGRIAGKDHAGTQGWRRPRQVAMPASRGERSLPIFLVCDPIKNHILLVGANGCSPEEDFLASRF